MATYTVVITTTTETHHTYTIDADDEGTALDIADHRLLDLDDEGEVREGTFEIDRAVQEII